MLSISLDAGEAPSVLAALADPANVRRVAHAAAASYNDDIHNWLSAGRGFTNRTVLLQQHTNWRPMGDEGEVRANTDYAKYVEEGTGTFVGHQRWVIAPKAGRYALRIPVSGGGGFIFRRSVIHPGSRPHPFFFADSEARGRRMVEAARSVLAAHAGLANV